MSYKDTDDTMGNESSSSGRKDTVNGKEVRTDREGRDIE
jgi:hypothetical protein